MRVFHRAAATAVVAALALVLIACDPAPTQPVARDRAAAWLVDQFGSDDSTVPLSNACWPEPPTLTTCACSFSRKLP